MNVNIKTWVADWFEKNTALNKQEINNSLSENYFENEWLDSIQFINFILDIETNFDISFNNDEFQNRFFATIGGVIEAIDRKINEKV